MSGVGGVGRGLRELGELGPESRLRPATHSRGAGRRSAALRDSWCFFSALWWLVRRWFTKTHHAVCITHSAPPPAPSDLYPALSQWMPSVCQQRAC